ncbi:serine hydrolase domain-containing protein [Croceicoccus bisphenolivorans]|uniref:serine hydrolase domain-containing protein n=1 Tax=Croceicoccus bisphenolivorans TaxID=1783232 RepID=UPI00082FCA87|nr:serine hydrolase domain-containing protein [Croceicoccus bisphenolivorans]
MAGVGFATVPHIVSRHIAAGEITGAITLIARNGELVLSDVQGTADFDPPYRLQADTIFGVMSMTKPVVGTLGAALVVEGALRLDAPVSEYIPEFGQPRMVRILRPGSQHRPMHFPPNPELDAQYPEPQFDYEPMRRPMTVRDIMTFTSGLQTIGIANPGLPVAEPDDSVASYIAKLGTVPLEFQPGTQWHYSNATTYDVLARLIEVASDTDFATFVQQRLFDPLGMRDSAFGVQSWMGDRVLPLGPFAHDRIARPDYPSGSAGLFTTAGDYLRFAQMLLNGGTYAGARILPEVAVSMVHSNQIGDLPFPGVRATEYSARAPVYMPGVRYGFGVATIEDRSTSGTDLPNGSYGWDGIGTRRFWVMPEQGTILIMLMTGIGAAADTTHREIEHIVAANVTTG